MPAVAPCHLHFVALCHLHFCQWAGWPSLLSVQADSMPPCPPAHRTPQDSALARELPHWWELRSLCLQCALQCCAC